MDSDKRGWLDITDFYNIFPESEVSDAFALFDHSTGKVTKDDMVSGVQNVRCCVCVCVRRAVRGVSCGPVRCGWVLGCALRALIAADLSRS